MFELLEEADMTRKFDDKYLGGFGCENVLELAFACSFNLDASFKLIEE